MNDGWVRSVSVSGFPGLASSSSPQVRNAVADPPFPLLIIFFGEREKKIYADVASSWFLQPRRREWFVLDGFPLCWWTDKACEYFSSLFEQKSVSPDSRKPSRPLQTRQGAVVPLWPERSPLPSLLLKEKWQKSRVARSNSGWSDLRDL